MLCVSDTFDHNHVAEPVRILFVMLATSHTSRSPTVSTHHIYTHDVSVNVQGASLIHLSALAGFLGLASSTVLADGLAVNTAFGIG